MIKDKNLKYLYALPLCLATNMGLIKIMIKENDLKSKLKVVSMTHH